jgi:transposase
MMDTCKKQSTALSVIRQCPNVHNCEHIAFLTEKIRSLTLENQELKQENHVLKSEIHELTQAIELLKGRLRKEIKNRFDKKSEKMEYMQPIKSDEQESSTTEDNEKPSIVVDNSPTCIDKESNVTLFDEAKKARKRTPHGRKIPYNLPVVEEFYVLSDEQCRCPKCGKKYRLTTLVEESYEIDIEIKIIRKKQNRRKYAQNCDCKNVPVILTAPKPSNIIYKSLYSTSLWTLLLVLKYYSQIPLYRQVNNIWGQYGGWFNNSTIIGGFKKLTEVLIPLYNKLIEVSRQEEHWHADETRWKVFVDKQDKKTFNWWMWVFASAKVVVYVLDRTRSSKVPKNHFGDNASGIINVDLRHVRS